MRIPCCTACKLHFGSQAFLPCAMVIVLLGVAIERATAAPTFLGPSPYLAFDNTLPGAGTAISPFSGLSFTYFHLETFEDHLLNTPGVTAASAASTFGVTSVVFGPTIHDSVDADDGTIDGSGLAGDSYFVSPGSAGVTFTFDAGVLGALPTHVGIVWTDGLGTVTFTAFGPGGSALGSIGPVSDPGVFPDSVFTGTTAEDRFFGVIDLGGISAISISNSDGGMEIDHLQYGSTIAQGEVPEASTLAVFSIGGLLFICRELLRRRRVEIA